MITKNQIYKLPSIIYAYYLAYYVLLAIGLSLVFSIFSDYRTAFRAFIVITLILFAFKSIIINAVYFVLNDSNITISHGVISKHSKVIPFDKIQNVNTSRGILMRLLGIATVNIWTASLSQIVNDNERSTRPDGILTLINEDAKYLVDIMIKRGNT